MDEPMFIVIIIKGILEQGMNLLLYGAKHIIQNVKAKLNDCFK